MKNKKIWIFLNTITLLLIITVSFAWIPELDTQTGKYFELNYNNLSISPTEVDVQLFRCEGSTNHNITQLNKTSAVYTATNVAPGDYTLYVLKITNESDVAMNVGINFTNIGGETAFYEFINIGISYVSGFSDEYPAPPINDFHLDERLLEGSATLIESMLLPPYESNGTNAVEIKFYIRLSHEATNAVQGKSFSIGTINVITT